MKYIVLILLSCILILTACSSSKSIYKDEEGKCPYLEGGND